MYTISYVMITKKKISFHYITMLLDDISAGRYFIKIMLSGKVPEFQLTDQSFKFNVQCTFECEFMKLMDNFFCGCQILNHELNLSVLFEMGKFCLDKVKEPLDIIMFRQLQ